MMSGWENPRPGGGGSQSVQVAKVTVTSAQLLGDAVVVVVPGVPGKILVPIGMPTIQNVPGTTPYTTHGGHISLGWGAVRGHQCFLMSGQGGILDSAVKEVTFCELDAQITGVDHDATVYEGLPLVVGNDAAPFTAPTAGDGELVVTVPYYIADVS